MIQWLSIFLNSLNSVKVMLYLGKTQLFTKMFPKASENTQFETPKWFLDNTKFHIIGNKHLQWTFEKQLNLTHFNLKFK